MIIIQSIGPHDQCVKKKKKPSPHKHTNECCLCYKRIANR